MTHKTVIDMSEHNLRMLQIGKHINVESILVGTDVIAVRRQSVYSSRLGASPVSVESICLSAKTG